MAKTLWRRGGKKRGKKKNGRPSFIVLFKDKETRGRHKAVKKILEKKRGCQWNLLAWLPLSRWRPRVMMKRRGIDSISE